MGVQDRRFHRLKVGLLHVAIVGHLNEFLAAVDNPLWQVSVGLEHLRVNAPEPGELAEDLAFFKRGFGAIVIELLEQPNGCDVVG